MKIFFILMICSWVLISESTLHADTEAKAPTDCNCTSITPIPTAGLDVFQQLLNSSVLSTQCTDEKLCDTIAPWAQEQFKKQPECAAYFLDGKGQLGKLGKLIVNQVLVDVQNNTAKDDPTHSTSVFLQDYPDIDAVCPGYKAMNAMGKVAFWTYTYEILGFLESSCNPKQLNTAGNVPNGPATGLYQLEPTPALRSWRGPHCKVSQAAILTPENNTACAIDVMAGLLKSKHRLFGERDKKGKLISSSYWESLNPLSEIKEDKQDLKRYRNLPHNRMLRYLRRYPACQLPAATAVTIKVDNPSATTVTVPIKADPNLQ